MIRFLLLALLFWFLYNLVFRLIIPAYKATKNVRKQFATMQERMQQQAKQQEAAPAASTNKNNPKPSSSDYIDFEEVK